MEQAIPQKRENYIGVLDTIRGVFCFLGLLWPFKECFQRERCALGISETGSGRFYAAVWLSDGVPLEVMDMDTLLIYHRHSRIKNGQL